MIISINQNKGGSGKTTSALNIGAGLARLGFKVLMIDSDLQANLSACLGYSLCDLVNYYTLADVLVGKVDIKDTIIPNRLKKDIKLDLIPMDMRASNLSSIMGAKKNSQGILKSKLSTIKDDYDFIIIDNMPSVSSLPMMSLIASDVILIPQKADFLCYYGLIPQINLINTLNQNRQSRAKYFLFFTMYDKRTNLSKTIKEQILKLCKDNVLTTSIPNNTALAESQMIPDSIFEYNAKSSGAVAYNNLIKEFLEKIKKNK